MLRFIWVKRNEMLMNGNVREVKLYELGWIFILYRIIFVFRDGLKWWILNIVNMCVIII